MSEFFNSIVEFFKTSGIVGFFETGGWKNLIMIVIACVLLFLAIKKKFEPYLLLPIAFGMLLVNLPFVANEIFTTTKEFDSSNLYTAEELFNVLKNNNITGLSLDQIKSIFEVNGTSMISLNSFYVLLKGNHEEIISIFSSKDVLNGFITSFESVIPSTSTYGGLIGKLYYGVKWGIYPCLIFLCIGATTDFGPLIANKKTMLLGAAAQFGIFITFIGAIALSKWLSPSLGYTLYTPQQASSIGIIGGADGPTAILVTSKLAPELLGSISVAAYSYMALVPIIQPPIIKLLTTKKERLIKMEQVREVSKKEKILFPIIVTIVTTLLVPSAAPLIGCLMLGNLVKESGVVPKITETLSNSLMYIVTILLGLCVGATAKAETFLTLQTIIIFGLGILAFSFATAAGVLGGKIMCFFTKGKVNPMIGAAGVSAVPMAARVVHQMGREEDPDNYLLMHAMGPNVAGVIGSAVAAGILLSLFA